MRFLAPNSSFSKRSANKFAGIAAALLILPVAVSCGTDTVADADQDITAELPAEGLDGEVTGEVAPDTMPEDTATAAEGGESIVDVASANGSFDTLVAAVQAAGLEETLDGEGPYTVFAPTDEAFASLPEGTVEKLVKPENQEALGQILAYHVVAGAVPSADIEAGTIGTVEGSEVEVAVDAAGVIVNGESNVVQPDVVADNGVIHVVDTVLLPPTFDPASLL